MNHIRQIRPFVRRHRPVRKRERRRRSRSRAKQFLGLLRSPIVKTSGSVSAPSPRQMNCPPTPRTIARYSRLARMQGGSSLSSLIALLLAMTNAPCCGCPRALRASAESLALSPKSDQLSQERLCHEQW